MILQLCNHGRVLCEAQDKVECGMECCHSVGERILMNVLEKQGLWTGKIHAQWLQVKNTSSKRAEKESFQTLKSNFTL